MSGIKKSVFGAYDIRGLCPGEIDEDIAYKIGKAYVFLFRPKRVVIGRDMRETSPGLFKALSKGIVSQGCDVIDIGHATTPLFNYSVAETGSDGGIMITASHNPSKYNGFKLTKKNSIPVSDKGIEKLERKIKSKRIKEKLKKGKIIKKDLIASFIRKTISYADLPKKKLKVVVDIGNGMSGLTAPKIFDKLNLNVKYLYKKIDQSYPNHVANPLEKKNMKDLKKRVIEEKADIGIAFDGDGDRVGFVSEKGEMVGMDLIIALISKYLLEKNPNSKILYDLRSSWIVRETIKKYKGKPIETRVGHSFIKSKMRRFKAVFAGETSGHYYFKGFSYCENSIVAALMVFNNLKEKRFSELMHEFNKYYKSEEMNFIIKNPNKKIKEIKKKYSQGDISKTDGIKIRFEDWWFNLRKSNTENLLRLNLEAKTKKLRDEKIEEIKRLIKKK